MVQNGVVATLARVWGNTYMQHHDKSVMVQNGVVARGLCVWCSTYMQHHDKSVMVGMELEMEQNLLTQNANKKNQQIQLVAKKVVWLGKSGMTCAMIALANQPGSSPGGVTTHP